MLLASHGLNTVIAAIFGVILVRYLGREQYGLLTTVYAYMFVFQIFASLGIDTIVGRDVAREPEHAGRIIGNAMGLRFLLAAASMVASWLFIWVIAPVPRVVTLQWILSLTMLFSIYPFYLVLYNVELRMALPKLVFGVWGLLLTGAKLAMIYLRQPLEAFVIAEAVSAAVVLLLARTLGRRSGLRFSIRFVPEHWWTLLKVSLPVAAALTFINIYLRIDQLMLYRMVGAGEVGLYGATVRVIEIVNVIPIVFMTSVFPILSRLSVESRERLDRATHYSLRAMVWVGLPTAALLYLNAEGILGLLFGSEFVSATPVMQLLAWSIPFVFLGSVLYNRMFSASEQKTAALIAFVAAAVNIALNLWLIPRYQGVGAAIATLVSYGCIPLMALVAKSSRPLGIMAVVSMIRPLVAVASGLGVLVWRQPGPISAVFAFLATYAVVLVVTGEWGRDEWTLIQRALGRVGPEEA